jgi:hypothetical protein
MQDQPVMGMAGFCLGMTFNRPFSTSWGFPGANPVGFPRGRDGINGDGGFAKTVFKTALAVFAPHAGSPPELRVRRELAIVPQPEF